MTDFRDGSSGELVDYKRWNYYFEVDNAVISIKIPENNKSIL